MPSTNILQQSLIPAKSSSNVMKETILGLDESKKEDFKKFFKYALTKFGYADVKSIPSDKKDSFFNFVNDNWKSLTETNSTGGVDGYETPNAFTGGHSELEKKRKHIATQLGYTIVGEGYYDPPEDEPDYDEIEDAELEAGDIAYDAWKDDQNEPREKDMYPDKDPFNEDSETAIGNADVFSKQELMKIKSHINRPMNLIKRYPNSIGVSFSNGKWHYMMYKAEGKYILSQVHDDHDLVVETQYNSFDDMINKRNGEVVRDDTKNENRMNESFNGINKVYSPKQQFGHAVREIRNNLSEVEKLVDRTLKLKNESGIQSEDYGKRAYKALGKINEKINKLMVSLHNFK